jgi:hypothetical protein
VLDCTAWHCTVQRADCKTLRSFDGISPKRFGYNSLPFKPLLNRSAYHAGISSKRFGYKSLYECLIVTSATPATCEYSQSVLSAQWSGPGCNMLLTRGSDRRPRAIRGTLRCSAYTVVLCKRFGLGGLSESTPVKSLSAIWVRAARTDQRRQARPRQQCLQPLLRAHRHAYRARAVVIRAERLKTARSPESDAETEWSKASKVQPPSLGCRGGRKGERGGAPLSTYFLLSCATM